MDEMNVRNELLAALPKADLHIHLDGSVKPETLLALAHSRGLNLPSDQSDELIPYMQVEDDCESLQAYLGKFEFVLGFMQDRKPSNGSRMSWLSRPPQNGAFTWK